MTAEAESIALTLTWPPRAGWAGVLDAPCGVEAWAVAAPTKQSLAAYSRTTTQGAAAEHPCPAIPQTDQAITIGGVPARLLGVQGPPGSGFLVETAVTIHDGTG